MGLPLGHDDRNTQRGEILFLSWVVGTYLFSASLKNKN